jgi:hypothetical protein
MSLMRLEVRVADLAAVLARYNRIAVWRSSTGADGTYAEITAANTRPRLVSGVQTYWLDDPSGDAADWYRVAYMHSDTGATSGLSDPQPAMDVALTTSVMTVQQLKDVYLPGIDLTSDGRTPYPDAMFEWGIKAAVDWLEKSLDLKLLPTRYVERCDYYRRDFEEWVLLRLRHAPIIDDLRGATLPNTSLTRVKVIWPGQETALEFDQRWIQIREEAGQLRLVPVSGSLSTMLLTASGGFLPFLAGGRDFMPDLFEVSYTAGFRLGSLPYDLRDMLGKRAAFGPLMLAGDAIMGQGIASSSLSIDGLSQSISTRASSQGGVYAARMKQYAQELKEGIAAARRTYKGIQITAV